MIGNIGRGRRPCRLEQAQRIVFRPGERPSWGSVRCVLLTSGHGLDPALVAEIVRRAHTAGVGVAAHVETAFDFEVAQLAGERVVVVAPTAFVRDRATASDTGWAN